MPGVRSQLTDGVMVLIVVVASLVLLAHGGLPLPDTHGAVVSGMPAVLTVAAAVPLVLWRRWPLITVLLSAGVSVALALAGGLVWPPLGIGAAVYFFARGPRHGARWPRAHQTLAGVAVVLFLSVALLVSPVAPVLHSAIACAALWFAGERSRLRRLEVHDLRAEALRTARETERERDVAVLAERTRIARDLHDSTAHALNVISLRAGTARLREDPAHALNVLADIEDLARDTIAEVERVVTNLRASAPGVEAPPGLAAFDGLVRQHLSAGHQVSVSVQTPPPLFPGTVDQGVFRILQEALTNAAKHGTGATTVRFDSAPGAWSATICNRPGEGVADGGGHGLIGIRERAAAIGASVDLNRTDDQFQLRLTLTDEAAS